MDTERGRGREIGKDRGRGGRGRGRVEGGREKNRERNRESRRSLLDASSWLNLYRDCRWCWLFGIICHFILTRAQEHTHNQCMHRNTQKHEYKQTNKHTHKATQSLVNRGCLGTPCLWLAAIIQQLSVLVRWQN